VDPRELVDDATVLDVVDEDDAVDDAGTVREEPRGVGDRLLRSTTPVGDAAVRVEARPVRCTDGIDNS